jgi:5-formyltetrahydrofolate cyclo-ligase
MPEPQGRWAGRDPHKDLIRHRVWDQLEAADVAVGPAWSMIPNFVGADIAAWRLSQTPDWQRAQTIKTNPDQAQMPIRLRALYQGKVVFAPVPYLTADFPYLRIDPLKMKDKGISFELAATAQGFVEHGDRIGFEEVSPLDFCVVGSVAVTRAGARTGKGAGFADLETAILRELGKIADKTPMATTVHSLQLVDSDAVVMRTHDSPLDYVATELELIETGNTAPRPAGVQWERVQPDQFASIPFLTELRVRILERRAQ